MFPIKVVGALLVTIQGRLNANSHSGGGPESRANSDQQVQAASFTVTDPRTPDSKSNFNYIVPFSLTGGAGLATLSESEKGDPESEPSDIKQTSATDPSRERLAVCFQTDVQQFLLVQTAFASGGWGHCSVWLGANDHKLYIRKLQAGGSDNVPRDVTHQIDHPNVPNLIAGLAHGAPPEDQWDRDGSAERYSIVTDFVDGPSLHTMVNEYEAFGRWIPENCIWQCGSALLSIVKRMRGFDGDGSQQALFHNDIALRNIVVENNIDSDDTTKFYLIDFGIATWQSETVGACRDLKCISSILSLMMQTGRRLKSNDSYIEPPFSDLLVTSTTEIYELSQQYNDSPPKEVFDTLIARFQRMTLTSKAKALMEGKETKLSFSSPLRRKTPLLFHITDEGEKELQRRVYGQASACGPYQKAIVDKDTWDIIQIDEAVHWGTESSP